MTDHNVTISGDLVVPDDPQKLGFMQFVQNIGETAPAAKPWIGNIRQNIRPWTTFFNTSHFKTPSLPRVGRRIIRNVEYFQSNYLFVLLGLVIYCILTSPWLLLLVPICLGVGYHLYKRQQRQSLSILGREVTLAQQYGVVAVCSIPLFMWAGIVAGIIWVLGASMVIIHSRATELYRAYLKTAGLALAVFIFILQAVVIDLLFFFFLYYLGASFIIILHATFFNIDAVHPPGDESFASLEV